MEMIWELVKEKDSKDVSKLYARRPANPDGSPRRPNGKRWLSIDQATEHSGLSRESLARDYRSTFADDLNKEHAGLLAPAAEGEPTFEMDPKSPEGIRQRVLKAFDAKLDLLRAWKYSYLDDDNWPLYLTLCEQHGLNPWSSQVFADFLHDEKTNKPKLVLIIGIAGIRRIAQRTGERDGASKAKFTYDEQGNPVRARVAVYRKAKGCDRVRYIGEAKLSEYEHLGNQKYSDEMPEHRLKKLAETQGYKQAFPEVCDIYTPDEVREKLMPRTPVRDDGRQIERFKDVRSTEKWDAIDPPAQDDVESVPSHGRTRAPDPLKAAFERHKARKRA